MKKKETKNDPIVEEFLEIDGPYKRFNDSVEEIEKIRTIADDIINFSLESFKNLVTESEKQKAYGLSRTIQNTITAFENIDKSGSDLSKKLTTIRNQSLVLLVSNFERFLSDFTVTLIDSYSYLIKWPDKKFSIDLGTFQYGSPTLGEVVLRSLRDKYSFQDLKSILDFSKELLGVNPKLSEDARNRIIFYHATRHTLVHNLGIIDEHFLKQTRNINSEELFWKGDRIDVKEDDYIEARDLFLNLAQDIYREVRKNMAPF